MELSIGRGVTKVTEIGSAARGRRNGKHGDSFIVNTPRSVEISFANSGIKDKTGG